MHTLHASYMQVTSLSTVSVLVHLSGCAFILDYQKKEWQVLLRALGFGRTIEASLHEDGHQFLLFPINKAVKHMLGQLTQDASTTV